MPAPNTQITPTGVEEALKEFAAFYEWKQSQKAVTLDYNVNSYGHGPGLFTPPMDPNVMNAMQLPQGGLEETLPEVPTNFETRCTASSPARPPAPIRPRRRTTAATGVRPATSSFAASTRCWAPRA
jgi:hypothetical protein